MAERVKLTPKQWLLAAGAAVLLVLLGVYLGSGRGGTTVVTPLPPLPQGQGPLNPQQQAVVDLRSRAAMEFVFFHELGHMVINELNLPAIGPEEDVADEFATFVLTDVLKAAPDNQKDLFSEIVYSGALFWRITGAIREAQNAGAGAAGATGGISWSDEHAPDLRRYYNILCIAVGADPLRFAGKAALDGVPQQRLSRCGEEYKTKHAAWDTLMAPHLAGFWHKTFGTRRLVLEIGPVGKNEWQPFETSYTQGGYFQQVLDGIDSTIALPETIPVIVKSCNGVSNAWWSPSEKRITLCHEFFQDVTNTFAVAVLADSRAQAQNGGPEQGPPQQGPPQQGPPQQAPPQQMPPPQPGGTVPPDTYQDPQGRFSVRVPAGWQGRQTNADVLAISRGGAFVTIMIGHDTASAQQVVTSLLQQIAPQWSQVRPGPAQAITMGGRQGFYHMLSGLNPKGVQARLYIAAAPLDQGGALAMITSVPEAEFEADKDALGLIQLSLRIGGGAPQAAPVQAAEPAPGRAVAAGTTGGLSWIAPGLRITYYAAAAKIDGRHTEMVLDEKGEWKYTDTGEIAAEVNKDDRASGEGYSQLNVVDVSGDTAAVEIRNFGIQPNLVTLPQFDGWVGSVAKGNDYWMNPADLRQMKDQKTQGLNVVHKTCTINGHTYNAIRIHTQTGGGSSQKTYDLDTGVLLLAGISSSGGSYQQRDPTNMVHSTPGATSLGMMRLVSIRQVTWPWNGMPAPSWVAQTPPLTYAGNYTVTVPGGPPQQLPFSTRLTVTRTGARWVQFTEEDTVQGPMMVPTQSTTVQRVAGSSQISGLWIQPEVLARLAPGQLDADPVTGYRVTFDGVRGNVAQFTEAGGPIKLQTMYDRTTGRLIGFAQSMPIGPSLLQVQASLR